MIKLIVVYDNYLTQAGLRTAHGFACVVRAGDRAVLFDTGGSGEILLENMDALGIDLVEIHAVVLSHMHWDHIGGLDAVLVKKMTCTLGDRYGTPWHMADTDLKRSQGPCVFTSVVLSHRSR